MKRKVFTRRTCRIPHEAYIVLMHRLLEVARDATPMLSGC